MDQLQHPYPHFAEALRAFGDTSPKIAKALGVSQRAAYDYMIGVSLPKVQIVKLHPELDQALTLDFAHRQKRQRTPRKQRMPVPPPSESAENS